ncbi:MULTISPECIES: type II toxin-antitoxin system RelE family toxin [unclassified Campylobacter]|uniref:type II toxin-antitoxin system RelE family toxin n=1 Tax=unclassified Campylobacter TaxID=2593542 RepID=UPI0022E9E25D|nr:MULTISPECIES: hypothetical protein [unclassified Campylobacter]MDA3042427.1 hypothetical protein [Campylobacter sp. JMF_09 ED2]MDA3044759.1 hypothetical protein [Campylobacter sp. JMF_07 ED4]MDA3063119.1 hypothetical protein [Campylobacter sp. JMF_11 EL3]MDA3071736.1 hypothetical protein [Campylobacter sp. VBCF_03 NA9]MDA3074200.1 hypothetical protein [Campylobacter sp. JMF_05 ED3]
MYKIRLVKKADKQLTKIKIGDKKSAERIVIFLEELEKIENPFALKTVAKWKDTKIAGNGM